MADLRILGTGRGVPEKVVDNHYFEKIVDTSDEWITERTGIKKRHFIGEGEAASTYATIAAKKAIDSSGLSPSDIDCIIVSTVTGDMRLPSTACFVQRELGLKGCAAFDISAACAGFIYGLSIAWGYLLSGQFKRILLIGVEILSPFLNFEDRTTCVLFGDGAGAVVLDLAEEKERFFDFCIYADGNYADSLSIPAGGSRYPASEQTVRKKMHTVHMNGREIYKVAVKNIAGSLREIMERKGLDSDMVDHVVAHQANLRILKHVAATLKMDISKFYINIHEYGNTSSASIPIALDEMLEKGLIKSGQTILMSALGGGITWGAATIKWYKEG